MNAWALYLYYAQTDTDFNLPYNPTRVLKVNFAALSLVVGWFQDIPLVLSFLHWRYIVVGKRFHEIVSQDIVYSPGLQCKLDVYHPDDRERPAPIIVFIYGGSWSSGSKRLYSTFANTLREMGYVVVVPDYRKYPQVKIDSMYDDVRQAIRWAYKHAREIRGDVEMLYVMGHSAGAHLAAQVIFSDVIEKAKYTYSKSTAVSEKYDVTATGRPLHFLPQVEGLFLFAGVYNIEEHLLHETRRGVDKISGMTRVMGSNVEGFRQNSPLVQVRDNMQIFAESRDIQDFIPRILFVHGELDAVVPSEQSTEMYSALGEVLPLEIRGDVDVRMRLYKRTGHAQCVTALMPNCLHQDRLTKSLMCDIKEFIDSPPPYEDLEELEIYTD
ncbi:hypothetical protein DFQ28_005809 [Apophysomyces sp. BC1034]|nr:hypothetical protein DFQ30_005759 [Apophysomyces sp. BC1015]KAG0177514.1 hypothetical protein DFQ29_004744 [Apophysomyces sp. BC1021]KAG0187825.1 hypothetical protein DFQ28_005809 [Apophysomyces sp. BC1034]